MSELCTWNWMRLNARVWSMHHTQKFSIAMSVPHLISIANWTNNNGNTVYKTHTRTCVSCYSIFVAVATAQRCQIYENAGKNKMLFFILPTFYMNFFNIRSISTAILHSYICILGLFLFIPNIEVHSNVLALLNAFGKYQWIDSISW